MFTKNPLSKTLKNLVSKSTNSTSSLLIYQPKIPLFAHTQKYSHFNVIAKWEKEHYYDSFEVIFRSMALKPIVNLKNCISRSPHKCIPISAVSKKRVQIGSPMKVACYMREYPAIFEEFTGPKYNLPWFRLTPEAAAINEEEERVFEDCKEDLRDRLRRFILMSKGRVLPFKIVQGMKWYLGLPPDIFKDRQRNFLDGSFRIVHIGDGLNGLGVKSEEKVLSCAQRLEAQRGSSVDGFVNFDLFPNSWRQRKIDNRNVKFQKIPYVSPYDDFSGLQTDGDIAEKRVVGVLHELLTLFVTHSAQRKKIRCLKKYLGLPQQFHKVFDRHPSIFYVSRRKFVRTAILKHAYCDRTAIARHPLFSVWKQYVKLMEQSDVIVKNRRCRNRAIESGSLDDDADSESEDESRVVNEWDCEHS